MERNKKKVGIYNRCSTEEEAQVNALAIQVLESREKALLNGWEIAEQYIESESGTTSYKRSEYQRLLNDMETDKFDIIMIKSIDRLMRSAKDWYIFLDKLNQYQKQLYIYIDQKFYTPEDSFITGIKAILAEDFSRELSKKIKNSHKRRQEKKSGLNITSPMFGWNKVNTNLFEINEEEAEAYRLAFELVREGKGFYTIANIMYENGVRSKKGNRISDVQWRKMIYSPRVHGTVILHTTEYDFETKKRIYLPEKEWVYIENALPPIISKEYHMEILEILFQRNRNNKSSYETRDMTKKGLYELSGKLYCSDCGMVYYRTSFYSKDTKLVEWKCSNALKHGRKTEKNIHGCNNINIMENTLITIIEELCKKHYKELFCYEETIIQEAMTAISKIINENSNYQEIDKLQKELNRQEKKKKVLFHKLMDEIISDKDFKITNQELSENIEQLQKKINNITIQNNDNNHSKERLLKIKNSLENGVVDKAKTKELISRIERINIHSDGTLQIIFNKHKILNLLKIYTPNLNENNLADELFQMKIKYQHKKKAEQRREQVNKQILKFFQENPNSTLKELPPIVDMSESYINSSIKMLKEQGLLCYERYGNHTGKWNVMG